MGYFNTRLLALVLACTGAAAQYAAAQSFPPAQVKRGAEVYAANCATRDGRARFLDSVTNGVRNMPPWGDVLKPDDIAALWSYLVEGEKGN